MDIEAQAERLYNLARFMRTISGNLYVLFETERPDTTRFISNYKDCSAFCDMLLEFSNEALPLADLFYSLPVEIYKSIEACKK